MKAWHTHARLILPVQKIEHDSTGTVVSVHLTCGRHTIVAPGSSIELIEPTGIFDKHGREIYDGDIIYITFYGFARVFWSDEVEDWTTDLCGTVCPTLRSFPAYLVMVAGNVWQTPELDTSSEAVAHPELSELDAPRKPSTRTGSSTAAPGTPRRYRRSPAATVVTDRQAYTS